MTIGWIITLFLNLLNINIQCKCFKQVRKWQYRIKVYNLFLSMNKLQSTWTNLNHSNTFPSTPACDSTVQHFWIHCSRNTGFIDCSSCPSFSLQEDVIHSSIVYLVSLCLLWALNFLKWKFFLDYRKLGNLCNTAKSYMHVQTLQVEFVWVGDVSMRVMVMHIKPPGPEKETWFILKMPTEPLL